MAKKDKNKEEKKVDPQPEEEPTKVPAPEQEPVDDIELTEESLKAAQEEDALLKEAMTLNPSELNEEQAALIRKYKDDIDPAQVEFYKDVIEKDSEEGKGDEQDPDAEPSPDYKKKFSESSREAQKKSAENRILNQAIAGVDDIPEPTDDELVEEYPEWDDMNQLEKRLAKEAFVSKKWRDTIKEARDQAEKVTKWRESVIEFVTDPKTLVDTPELEGKEDKFVEFATKDENNSVPISILTGAFLHQQSTSRTSNKGQMFPRGTTGKDRGAPKDGKISVERARELRINNYSEYRKLLKAKKIRFS